MARANVTLMIGRSYTRADTGQRWDNGQSRVVSGAELEYFKGRAGFSVEVIPEDEVKRVKAVAPPPPQEEETPSDEGVVPVSDPPAPPKGGGLFRKQPKK